MASGPRRAKAAALAALRSAMPPAGGHGWDSATRMVRTTRARTRGAPAVPTRVPGTASVRWACRLPPTPPGAAVGRVTTGSGCACGHVQPMVAATTRGMIGSASTSSSPRSAVVTLRASSAVWPRGPGPGREQVIVVDDRRVGPPTSSSDPAPIFGRSQLTVVARRGAGSGGRPQRRLAVGRRAVGGVPRRRRRAAGRVAGRLGRRPGRLGEDVAACAGPDQRAAAGRSPADRLGAPGRRAERPPVGSRPTWPCAGRAAPRRRVRRALPRAYREDADLAVRLRRAGTDSSPGRGGSPIRSGRRPWSISIRRQAGNVDDALMRRKHGRSWRRAAEAGRGRLAHHAATTASLGARRGRSAAGRQPARSAVAVAGPRRRRHRLVRLAAGPTRATRRADEIARMARDQRRDPAAGHGAAVARAGRAPAG